MAQADEKELDAARIELHGLFGTVFAIAPVFDQLFGPGAFGFGTVGAVFRAQRSEGEARLLVLWLALRENEQLREGMAVLVSAASNAAATQTIYDAFTKWREEIPAFAEVLSDDSLAAALKDDAQQKRFNDEFGRLCQAHQPEVESFFTNHPELEPAMAVFEDHA